jgi:hypothetical protein
MKPLIHGRRLHAYDKRGEAPMPNTKQDRAKVAGGQDHEVEYEARKTGASKNGVKDAVKSVGNSRKSVEKRLSK